MNEEQIREIKEAFDLFDVDGTGRVDPREIVTSIRAHGLEHTRPEVRQIIDTLGSLGDQFVDFQQFLKITIETMVNRDPYEELKKAFDRFDDDNTGSVSFRNLKRAALELGEQLTDRELSFMLSAADSDLDGEISFDDFVQIMKSHSIDK